MRLHKRSFNLCFYLLHVYIAFGGEIVSLALSFHIDARKEGERLLGYIKIVFDLFKISELYHIRSPLNISQKYFKVALDLIFSKSRRDEEGVSASDPVTVYISVAAYSGNRIKRLTVGAELNITVYNIFLNREIFAAAEDTVRENSRLEFIKAGNSLCLFNVKLALVAVFVFSSVVEVVSVDVAVVVVSVVVVVVVVVAVVVAVVVMAVVSGGTTSIGTNLCPVLFAHSSTFDPE